MADFSFEHCNVATQRFSGTEDQEKLITEWRPRYDQLIGVLGSLGTQVRVDRVHERDQDIAPYNFMRSARHEFVFPPQTDLEVVEDNSRIIDNNPDYALRREAVTHTYDEEAVEGHLTLFYDDSDGRIGFNVTPGKDKADFPEEVLAALDTAFPQPVEAN